jgi:hypothetical protein
MARRQNYIQFCVSMGVKRRKFVQSVLCSQNMKSIIFIFLCFTTCQTKTDRHTRNTDMKKVNEFFINIYENFNERKIEQVISNMTPNVKWANGMDGGFVYGHEGVRQYWIRQFKLVSSNVTPMDIRKTDGEIVIKVHQVVRDLQGKLLADEIVTHAFRLDKDQIAEFNIRK